MIHLVTLTIIAVAATASPTPAISAQRLLSARRSRNAGNARVNFFICAFIGLDRHTHQIVKSGGDFVAHLHQRGERERRLLAGDHRTCQIIAFAHVDSRLLLLRHLLELVNVTERALHNAVKRNVRVGGTEGHGGQHRRLGVGLHPLHVLHDLRLHGAVDCGNAHF